MSTTEQSSAHDNLQLMSTSELLGHINDEDQTVPHAVAQSIDQIEKLVAVTVEKMQVGGRLFYIGAGTSGRLGIVDASEIPPTYGLPQGRVIGLIAGGDGAIRQAVENAEDDDEMAWKELQKHQISDKDVLIGIAASGRTPYVIGGIRAAGMHGIATGCIVCNNHSRLAEVSHYPIEVVVGPEFVTGSTRMKAGTAQKLVLNMISTSVMIQLGHVQGNKMIDMQLSNAKLVDRAIKMVMQETNAAQEEAQELVKKYGSVRKAVAAYNNRSKCTK